MAEILGTCELGFEGVREAFSTNFDEGDLGASCAVVYQGELVVDLWGGHRDVAETKPWARDTIVNVWSTTKMIAALCVLVLHDRGALSVDDPVVAHWPEFSAAGKEGVLIRHLMSHTAGVPGFDPPITKEEMYDWDFCCANLAAQTPWWEPGTASGYHASTQGWLLGEVVRRVTGRTLGTFFREEIAGPLGADFHIGLDDAEFGRVAEVRTDEAEGIGNHSDPIPARQAQGEAEHTQFVNTDRWRRAEFPASNGHGNARSVVQVVSILTQGGESQGLRFLGQDTIERIFEVQASGPDLIIGHNMTFGIGYGLSTAAMPLGINDRTLFWAGWGGSMAVVDVENSLAVCYAMNRMKSDVVGDMRAGRVIFAAHGAGTALRA